MILTAVSLFAAAMILAALGTMAVIRRAERQHSFDDRRYALLETLPDALLIVDDRWCFTQSTSVRRRCCGAGLQI